MPYSPERKHKTRQKILDAIEREGFIPNQVASSMRGAGRIIGTMVPPLINSGIAEQVQGMSDEMHDSGYQLLLIQGDFNTAAEEKAIRALLGWRPAGLILQAFVQGSIARQILAAQTARLASRGWTAMAGTELEFVVYLDSYEQAAARDYRDLTPANQYNVDYSILGTARIEPLLRRIRLDMAGAGLYVESAKGECNLGQHEIAFRYAEAVTTCDNHSIYKTGAKEIAAQDGNSITFMAKPNAREGNSCHIHLSLRGSPDGAPVMAGDGAYGLSKLGEHFLAGQLAAMRELALCYAPNINSYKRYVPGSFAPTSVRWGVDNRTCALRLVGHGPSLRVENRVPGGDVNPYLAVAAMIAAGLHGIDNELPLEPPLAGNAYADTSVRVPHTLYDALDLWEKSELAREAFGAEVVEHYANYARVELTAYEAAVTDWELRRGFERL